MSTKKIKSFAKVNLALNVTGKLVSLHKIETIVSFVKLHDLIRIKKTYGTKHQISFNGTFSKNIKNHINIHFDVQLQQEKFVCLIFICFASNIVQTSRFSDK